MNIKLTPYALSLIEKQDDKRSGRNITKSAAFKKLRPCDIGNVGFAERSIDVDGVHYFSSPARIYLTNAGMGFLFE